MAIKSLTRVANSKVITIATYVRTGYGISDDISVIVYWNFVNCKTQLLFDS